MRVKSRIIAIAFAAVGTLLPLGVFAAPTPTLNQTVGVGSISTDILANDGSTPVAAPVVNFDAVTKSLYCQTSTKDLGDTNNKLYVTNLATNNGFTLTMAPTAAGAALWTGGTYSYDFDDPTDNAGTEGAGCANGQLSVDPSSGTAALTLDCNSNCSSAGITQGAADAYDGSTPSITLMSNANGDAWQGYLTGIELSQAIPDGQDEDAYALPMTITVAAV